MTSDACTNSEKNLDTAARPARAGRLKGLLVSLPFAALIVAGNHLEYHFRHQRATHAAASPVVVRSERNALVGHSTIGIDENASVEGSMLRFSTLGQWDFNPQSPSPCPKAIEDMSGRDVSCVGFMYPLESETALKTFCLLRTTQTCCFGPRPQFSQYILVEMPQPVKFERLAPVIVRGKFFVDAQPSQGYIYRMEGVSVASVAGEEADVNPADAACAAGLPLFDYSAIAALKDAQASECPPEVLALDGKRAVVAGYFVDRGDNPARLLVGRSWWDGVAQGERPNIYNAVMVYLADASEMPPLWKQKGLVTGILSVARSKDAWSRDGIVSVRDAVVGTAAKAPRRGPILNLWQEALCACAAMCLGLWRGSSAGSPPISKQEA